MFKIGDKVKVVASKELKKWTDKVGKDCIGKVCTITSMGQDPEDNRRVVYCLNDNQYGINFPASSLKKTTAPLTKEVKKLEVDEKPAEKKIEGIDGLFKMLEEVIEDVEKEEKKEKEAKHRELGDILLSAVAAQTLTLTKKVNRLVKSDRYLGLVVWAIVAYLVFDVIIRFLA